MGNEFDTKQFIHEVEIRPEIWHRRLKTSREEQQKAWHKIGETLFVNWALCPIESREERVREMKTLWSNIEEKFYHELQTNNFKGKKCDKYKQLLSFLRSSNVDSDGETRKCGKVQSGKKGKTSKRKTVAGSIPRESESDDIDSTADDDESFFKSILPTIKKLDDQQKMDLRLEILYSLKKIKNNNPNEPSSFNRRQTVINRK